MNLDFAKVCGKHSAIYEAYYKQIDPKGSGAIEAMTAAKFLKKSGLSDVVLSRVWDLSDPNGKGFLDKPGFFVALKLVSLAQAGQVVNMSNIYTDTANPPKVGDIPKIMPPRIQTVPVSSGGVANGDWSVSVLDRLKYEQLFETLKPVGGMLPGNKVKGVLMDSKLPMETLGKIWDLADQDKDGNLDKHEFIVAMHLVYQTLEKRTVPDVLPAELRKPVSGHPPPKPAPPITTAPTATGASMPRAPSGEGFGDGGFVANFPKDIAPPPAIPPLPVAVPPMTRIPPVGSAQPPLIPTDPLIPIGAPPSVTANADWVVTPAELKRIEVNFRESDRDKDGLVSGLEVKNVFLQSGVPQNCLAHIWALCDTNQSGKLTLEQFALAMWMVERKQKGIEPPQVLTANMVPPSMRGIVSGVDVQPQVEPKPTYSNPELEMISKEIEELAKERRALETEIAQKEADIRIKSGEVRSLQSELDTLSATLKQLENQRGEAQKRLDDLKAQVNKIRDQCQKQEETINEQEGELNAKRSELQKLKDEEAALQKEYDGNNRELQKLTQHLQNTQLQISSVRSMVTQLMETQRQMTDALLMCRAAIESQDGELVSEYQLKIEPELYEARKTLEKKIEEPKADPFEDNKNVNAKPSNGFTTANGFDSDPFAASNVPTRTGFDDNFSASSGFDSGFDAFGSSGNTFGQQKDPFGGDAFGASKPSAATTEVGKDDFGSDPFAALHAPTGQGQVLSPNTQKSGPPPRPESPSPALPPKKSKVPPPRPAPPRPNQGPARPAQPTMDAFGSTSNSSSGFADFADFDNKLSTIPTPVSNPSSQTLTSTPFALTTTTSTSFSTLGRDSLLDINPLTFKSTTSTTTSTSFTTATTTTTTTMTPSFNTTSALLSNIVASTIADSFSITTVTTKISTTTTSSSATTTANNHLTQQATSIFASNNINDIGSNVDSVATNNTGSISNKSISSNKSTDSTMETSKKAGFLSGPTDFSDDPFKDYRYEDPFNIKDPFADDDELDDPEKVFKDDLSSDDEEKKKDDKVVPSHIPIGNDFLDNFDAFNLNSDLAPSQQSSTTIVPTESSISTDNDNQQTSTGSTVFDNFADFDAFATKPTTTSDVLAEKKENNNNTKNNNLTTNSTDTFFDAFNDSFDTNSNMETISNKTKNNDIFDAFSDTNKNIKSQTGSKISDAFDAFGSVEKTTTTVATASTVSSAKLFDEFNANAFEDDFFKTQNATTTKDNSNITTNNKTNNNAIENFAKFDAFGEGDDFASNFQSTLNNYINMTSADSGARTGTGAGETGAGAVVGVINLPTVQKLTKVQNQTTLSKKSNIDAAATANKTTTAAGDNTVKVTEKFAADYSKPESFDADLEEALKRSMMDQ